MIASDHELNASLERIRHLQNQVAQPASRVAILVLQL